MFIIKKLNLLKKLSIKSFIDKICFLIILKDKFCFRIKVGTSYN